MARVQVNNRKIISNFYWDVMPRTWLVILLALVGFIAGIALAICIEGLGGSPHLAVACAGVIFALVGFATFRIYPFPLGQFSPGTSSTAEVQRYLRWLIRDIADNRLMLGASLTERVEGIPFAELFCDLNVYGFNQRRLSLSRWLSETKLGETRYGAVLLGPPGSGKSVTLQAILLSCANSAFFGNISPTKSLLRRWQMRSSTKNPVQWCFDPTWILPAPSLVPVLVKLGSFEHYFNRYCSGDDRDVERDLLVPILNNLPELGLERFRSLLEAGRLALLFDGLDELRREAWRVAALELVNFLWLRGGERPNLFVVACRIGSFSAQLRDAKPRGFGEVDLEKLTAEDKRAIVAKLIEADLRPIPNRANSLLSGVPKRLGTTLESENGSTKYRLKRSDLLDDLVSEIVDRVPQGFTSWKPADFPLSLRRMTTVILSRPREHLHLRRDPGDERPHWRLEVGLFRDSVLDYTNIIEEDLREFLARRSLFAEVNGYPRDEMLRLYGELAYGLSAGSESIPEEALRGFVAQNTSSTQLSADQSFEAFCAPGIISEVDSRAPVRRFAFRDVESADFLAAFYMVSARDPEAKIDEFLARDEEFIRSPPPCVSMAFARLKGDALRQFVSRTNYFREPAVLSAFVAGIVGSPSFGVISEREGEVLLERCLAEVKSASAGSNHLRPWQIIRHIIFRRRYPEWTASALIGSLELKSSAPPEDFKAQMCLVVAEFAMCFLGSEGVADAKRAIERHLGDGSLMVRACCSLALEFLGHVDNAKEGDSLWASVEGGYYLLGDPLIRDNPQQRAYIKPFRVARFPVLRFQYLKGIGGAYPNNQCPPGEAFKPMVGLGATDAEGFATQKSARLPSSAEFEVVAAYHGDNGHRRVYPWGDEFGANEADLALERSSLRAILHDPDEASPVAMKPHLATPGGVFDLVSNVWQLTSDRSPLEQEEPEVIMFGPPLSCDDQDLFRCVERSPVPLGRIPKRVGFRLVR